MRTLVKNDSQVTFFPEKAFILIVKFLSEAPKPVAFLFYLTHGRFLPVEKLGYFQLYKNVCIIFLEKIYFPPFCCSLSGNPITVLIFGVDPLCLTCLLRFCTFPSSGLREFLKSTFQAPTEFGYLTIIFLSSLYF